MSYNISILSYNKNEEIKEYEPLPSPSISSNESNEKNELIYHSCFIPSKISINEDTNYYYNFSKTKTNFNLYKSFSSSPLIFNSNISKQTNYTNNIYNTKSQNIFWKKKSCDINDNKKKQINKNKNMNKISKKNPRKKKLLNTYSSYRNIKENKYYDKIKNNINNKIKKIKTISIRKSDIKEFKEKKDVSNGNVTIKNENVENRIEFDKTNKKINIYIKNNIYNYNLINDINSNSKGYNLLESQNSSEIKSDIKITSEDYLINNNDNNYLRKKNNKKPTIKTVPMDNINKKNNNNKNNIKFDFPIFDLNKNIQNQIRIQNNKNIKYKNFLPKLNILYKKSNKNKGKINPILNILSFLNQKEIIETIIQTRNKKLILIINKSLIDSYYINLKKNLKKYNNFLELIKSTLIYSYSKDKNSLKIDFMLSIRFIDKKNKITKNNPKHFQLLYLFDFIKEIKNKNRLFDCYGFDIIPVNTLIEKNDNEKKFKGIYLSKQMSRFNIDKNDELINIQPILPFKYNDKGIFNFEIYSNQNYFINPKNIKIKLNILDLYSNKEINELRINEYDNICKYWKVKGGYNEKKIEIYKGIIKEWFDKFFLVKDIFYADIGLCVFKFNLIANKCGILTNENLNVKIIIKEKEDYIENEIKKNNLLFERNNVFQIRKGENLIFFLSMY